MMYGRQKITHFSKASKKLDKKILMNDLAHALKYEIMVGPTGKEVALYLYDPPVSHENIQTPDVASFAFENYPLQTWPPSLHLIVITSFDNSVRERRQASPYR